jgi:glutathione S-transferase
MERYRKEVSRQMRVMDAHLESEIFAGAEYSVADMAIYPWWGMLRPHFEEDRPACLAGAFRLQSKLPSIAA